MAGLSDGILVISATTARLGDADAVATACRIMMVRGDTRQSDGVAEQSQRNWDDER